MNRMERIAERVVIASGWDWGIAGRREGSCEPGFVVEIAVGGT